MMRLRPAMLPMCALLVTGPVLLSATACRDEARPKPETSPAKTTIASETLSLSVDATDAIPVDVGSLDKRVPLASVLGNSAPPREEWVQVDVSRQVEKGGRELHINLESYEGHQVLLDRNQGKVRIGLYSRGSKPRALQLVVEPTHVHVWTKTPPTSGTEALPVVVDGRQVTLSHQQLQAVATKPWRPDGRRKENVGWQLASLLEAAGSNDEASVEIVDTHGLVRAIAAEEAPSVLVKRSSVGGFQAKSVVNGKTAWRLRELVRIEVATRAASSK